MVELFLDFPLSLTEADSRPASMDCSVLPQQKSLPHLYHSQKLPYSLVRHEMTGCQESIHLSHLHLPLSRQKRMGRCFRSS